MPWPLASIEYVLPSAERSTTVTAMNGGTSILRGVIFPPRPVNSACVEIGVSSPDCCSLDVDFDSVVVVGGGSDVLPLEELVVMVVDGAGCAAVVVFPPPPPPPQPAIATTAANTRSALNRMGLSRLEDHDLRRGLRLDVRLERLVVGLDRRGGGVVGRGAGGGAGPVCGSPRRRGGPRVG